PRRRARSPVNVAEPTTIHGSRHTGIATCARAAGTGRDQARRASVSQEGTGQRSPSANSRARESSACGTVSMTVTHTGTPASRSRRTSSSRFSSLLATTRSGPSAATAARSGFLVPRTRATSRSAGCVHQSVAPTSASRRVCAIASVSEGTRDTTRRAGPATGTGCPMSSRATSPPPLLDDVRPGGRPLPRPPGVRGRLSGPSAPHLSHVPPVLAADLEERFGDLLEAADPCRVHEDREHVLVVHGGLLEPLDRLLGLLPVRLPERLDPPQLRLLLLLGGAGQFDLLGRAVVPGGRQEGVDAD